MNTVLTFFCTIAGVANQLTNLAKCTKLKIQDNWIGWSKLVYSQQLD